MRDHPNCRHESTTQLEERLGRAEQEVSRLHGIQQVADAALARLPLDELLLAILDRARLLLSGDTAAVLLLDERTDELLVRAARGLEEGVERGVRVPLGRGFAGRIAAERRPIVLHDVDNSQVVNPVLQEKGVRSLVGVPLLVEDRLLGVLHVGTLRHRPFSQDEVEVLEAAAQRVALALDRAQALEAEQRANARLEALLHDLSRAEDESLRLRRLQQITDAALAHLTVDELTDVLLERIQFLLGVDTAAILLREGDRLVVHAARGLDEPRGLEIRVGEGFAGTIAATAAPLAIDDLEASTIEIVSAALRDRQLRSLVGVPLVLEGEVTGVLHVGSLTPRAFGASEVELLQAAAGRMALAVARAAAYEAAEAARVEREAERARLAAILRGLEAVVWETDDPGRRHFGLVSGRAEELLGYPLERWHEEGFWSSIVAPEEREAVELYFHEGAARAEPHELEYSVVAADGRPVRVRELVRPEAGVLRGLLVDVTARHDLERRLLQAQKMEAVGQLAGGIAHDFNNLLTVITGFANVMEQEFVEEPARTYLGEIRSAARRAGELTTQLLTFSRTSSEPREVVEPNEVVDAVQTMLERLIDEDIRLELRLGEQLPPVRIERGQLEQVLVNLVVNARDAIAPRPGVIRIETTAVSVDRSTAAEHRIAPGSYSVVVVSDTGSGMDEQTRSRIFEPFYTTKPIGKGTGLGLATVYGIVEAAGGRIEVESELGRGSDFVVYLPAAPDVQPAESPVPEPDEQATTVLLVEDEPALRSLAKLVLEQESYRVLEARNGRDALALAERSPRIDLVITDVVMPELGGPELVSRLSELGREPKVVYMSGYVDSRLAQRGLTEHALLLRKPFEPQQLRETVRQLLCST